jgi:hypothetical protein
MGYLRHHAIIVTGWDRDDLMSAYGMAHHIFSFRDEDTGRTFDSLVSPIIPVITNSGGTFLIAPDGSKEWWDTSDTMDRLRGQFCDELAASSLHVEWCEVIVGSDDDEYRITRSRDQPHEPEDDPPPAGTPRGGTGRTYAPGIPSLTDEDYDRAKEQPDG